MSAPPRRPCRSFLAQPVLLIGFGIMQATPVIIVHGGAGFWPADLHDRARDGCGEAAKAGMAVLAQGGSALDAVQAAVRVLEDASQFNAGVGAVLNRDGQVEVDAALMDGATLRFGAVAAMANARQPIDIARAVLDDGEHVLLCAQGAWRFARERGYEPCDPSALITERARERWQQVSQQGKVDRIADPGTVGAVARDRTGHVAAATSTGGTTYKRPGRIGDTPLCGCGTYADDRGGGASATGHGESIIRVGTTISCVRAMQLGAGARAAAWATIDELAARVQGEAGIICIGPDGSIGAAHNSKTMAFAAARLGQAGDVTIVADVAIDRSFDIDCALGPRPGTGKG
jgi:L-asparaginase / beta-aspartyl-peptidase